jgi:hypothetical protein
MTADELAEAGVGIEHHFGGGVYAKETIIPPGVELTQHVHDFDHLSVLADGIVDIEVDGVLRTGLMAPRCFVIKAGSQHKVTAVIKSTWYCIHATGETDPAKVDAAITGAAA